MMMKFAVSIVRQHALARTAPYCYKIPVCPHVCLSVCPSVHNFATELAVTRTSLSSRPVSLRVRDELDQGVN